MQNKPLISVIVPVYKVEKYLKKCVESLQNQTYKNLEIILVDDGSPDNSPKMCDELMENDCRIKVVHKENGGQSSARNVGLEIAKGEWIAFVDSDDYIDQDMLEKLYQAIEENQADMAVCSARLVNEQGHILSSSKESGEVKCYAESEAYDQLIPTLNNSVWNKLFKKELLGKLLFPVGCIHGEDFIFLLEYLRNVRKVVIIDVQKYNYLQREGSVTSSSFSKRKLDEIRSKDRVFEIISEYYPQYTETARKWKFTARINVIRSIVLSKVKKEYKEEYKSCLIYLKNNYKYIKLQLSKKEKIEYFLQRYLRCFYPIIIKTALKNK